MNFFRKLLLWLRLWLLPLFILVVCDVAFGGDANGCWVGSNMTLVVDVAVVDAVRDVAAVVMEIDLV